MMSYRKFRRSKAQKAHALKNLKKINKENISPSARLEDHAQTASDSGIASAETTIEHRLREKEHEIRNGRRREKRKDARNKVLQQRIVQLSSEKEAAEGRLTHLEQVESENKDLHERAMTSDQAAMLAASDAAAYHTHAADAQALASQMAVRVFHAEGVVHQLSVQNIALHSEATQARWRALQAEHAAALAQAQAQELAALLEARTQSFTSNLVLLGTQVLDAIRGSAASREAAVYDAIMDERRRTDATFEKMEAQLQDLEGRLKLSFEEADVCLEDARQLVATQEASNAELTGELEAALRRIHTLRKQNDTLRKRVERAPAQKARAVSHAVLKHASSADDRGGSFQIKHKGIIPPHVRALVRDLLELGVSVGQVNDTIAVVARSLGVSIEGSLSARSVERIALEGLVAAYCQLAEEIQDADGITASGDGTSYRNTQLESRHIILNKGDSHQRRFLGIHSAPNHTSDTQLEGWKELTSEIFETYNKSPKGKLNPADPRSFPAKLCGMMTDHAEDQKRLGRLTREWKIAVDRELRGERAIADHSPSDLLLRLAEETARATEKIGREAWDALTPEELAAQDREIRRAVYVALGEEAYSKCSDAEKRKIDLFVHAGCCMHKELNAVKGGNTAMMAYWNTTNVAPVLLMNRDNHAAAAAGTSKAQARAVKRSTGGGVKLTELSGGVFHHRDDRKGQQDAFRYHMEIRTGKPVPHPDTTNIRYQSHCTAAGFLIVYYDHVITYLDDVKDRKTGDGGWNHMEANVARGLRDDPTLTELCVLALYAQAISHPYMREVRRANGASALSLGPFHDQLKTHLTRLIADPDLLLGPNAAFKSATLDGQEWKDPHIVCAVRERAQTLPHTKGALVAFLKGALTTWERFTAEFVRGGVIDTMDAKDLEKAHMDKGNDVNEGALGKAKNDARKAPAMSFHQRNARGVYRHNDVGTHIATSMQDDASQQFLRSEAREIDGSGREKKRKRGLVETNEQTAKRRRKQRADRAQRKEDREGKLKQLHLILDEALLTDALTVKAIEEQLRFYRTFCDPGPRSEKKIPTAKSLGSDKPKKLKALIEAVQRYKTNPPDLQSTDSETEDEDGMSEMEMDEDDEDEME